MASPRISLFLTLVVGFSWFSLAEAVEPPKWKPEQLDFFENKIRPLLAEHCFRCHGDKKQQAGLRLDNAAGVRKGTDEGAVIVPGEPDKSKLIKSILHTGDYAMPPNKPMPKAAVDLMISWVKMGAPYPEDTTQIQPTAPSGKHWSFQPIRDQQPPFSTPNPIDGFVQAKLRDVGLSPNPVADRRTLIRRAYFDLSGLPPTAEAIEAFEKDPSSNAFEKVIDQLLSQPQFGERWARYWLDLARYSDSKGYVFTEDRNYPYAYTFRDYVIRALNEDKPYTRFITEQLAADKLDLGAKKQHLAAMGFLTVGRRFSNNIHDIIDDRIDVVTRGFLGLTLQCARCHDHKYDPVPIADYYTLYGIFANSPEPKDYPLIGEVERTPEYVAYETELNKRLEAVKTTQERHLTKRTNGYGALVGTSIPWTRNPERVLNRADRDQIKRLQKQVDSYRAASQFAPPRAMVLNDNPNPTQSVVFLRGNPGNRGPKAPRQIPTSLTTKPPMPINQGSGRLELAKAITDPSNPLTARVAVNRVWGHLIGQHLVRTPSDFGLRSELPTHPELLDWLASRFMQDGWSTKKLIKRIMLSQTYQQGSNPTPQALGKDPENRWLSHMNRRRLDFESLRDSLLAVSGQLDPTVFGRSVNLFTKPFTTRRTLYASVDRQNLPGTFRVFDFSNPDQHAPSRVVTTVPQQALYLMNNPFVVEQAQATVTKLKVSEKGVKPPEQVRRLYRGILARNPNAAEAKLAIQFLSRSESTSSKTGILTPIEQLAQVLLLSNEFTFVD